MIEYELIKAVGVVGGVLIAVIGIVGAGVIVSCQGGHKAPRPVPPGLKRPPPPPAPPRPFADCVMPDKPWERTNFDGRNGNGYQPIKIEKPTIQPLTQREKDIEFYHRSKAEMNKNSWPGL